MVASELKPTSHLTHSQQLNADPHPDPTPGALCRDWGHRAGDTHYLFFLLPPSPRASGLRVQSGHRTAFLHPLQAPPTLGEETLPSYEFPEENVMSSAPNRRTAWDKPCRHLPACVPSCGQGAPHPPPGRDAARRGAAREFTPKDRPCKAAAPGRRRQARRS